MKIEDAKLRVCPLLTMGSDTLNHCITDKCMFWLVEYPQGGNCKIPIRVIGRLSK